MLASYVVRLVTEALDHGVLAGEVHVVESGRRIVVRNKDELIAALLELRSGSQLPAEADRAHHAPVGVEEEA